jgi:hypothetical protein
MFFCFFPIIYDADKDTMEEPQDMACIDSKVEFQSTLKVDQCYFYLVSFRTCDLYY